MHTCRGEQPTIFDSDACAEFCRRFRVEPDRLRRARHALLRMSETLAEALGRLEPDHRTRALDFFEFQPLRIFDERMSQLDGSTKFLLEAKDGARLETVLLRAKTARTTVCVSSQIGCRAGCPFCATARMGLVRNLTASEILEQVRITSAAARIENRRVRNIVFMGMGEPLHNEENLHIALERLTSEDGFAFHPQRISVSTVGIPDAMLRLMRRFPSVQLALSLHAASPEQRERLVPWSRRYSWEQLWDAVREICALRSRKRSRAAIMIEYLMIDGVNDSLADARTLARLLEGLNAIVNLIPYNPIPYVQAWQPTPRADREAFAGALRGQGVFTTIRYSMGRDVQAACGQLVLSGQGDRSQNLG